MTSTEEDNARIATLTSDAVRHSGEKVVEDIMATVEAVEQTAAILRQEAETLAEEIRKHTDAFANRVSTYVENCHRAVGVFQAYQNQIVDLETKPVTGAVTAQIAKVLEAVEEKVIPRPRIASKVLPIHPKDLDVLEPRTETRVMEG